MLVRSVHKGVFGGFLLKFEGCLEVPCYSGVCKKVLFVGFLFNFEGCLDVPC